MVLNVLFMKIYKVKVMQNDSNFVIMHVYHNVNKSALKNNKTQHQHSEHKELKLKLSPCPTTFNN